MTRTPHLHTEGVIVVSAPQGGIYCQELSFNDIVTQLILSPGMWIPKQKSAYTGSRTVVCLKVILALKLPCDYTTSMPPQYANVAFLYHYDINNTQTYAKQIFLFKLLPQTHNHMLNKHVIHSNLYILLKRRPSTRQHVQFTRCL